MVLSSRKSFVHCLTRRVRLQTQLDSNANVTVVDSHIRGNSAQSGGAIHLSGSSTLRLERSSITDNSAAASGGGILVRRTQAL